MANKTIHILHGGNTSKDCKSNREFYSLFTQSKSDHINILLCLWAREKSRWPEISQREANRIAAQSTKPKSKYSIQTVKDAQDFEKIVNEADVVYFVAGRYPHKLIQECGKINQLKELLKKKTVIGSSAGAFMLCKYSINSFGWQGQEINRGLAVLPYNILCHTDIDAQLDSKINRIKSKSNSQLILLKEGEFTTIVI